MTFLLSSKLSILLTCLIPSLVCGAPGDVRFNNPPSCYRNKMVEANNYLNAQLLKTIRTSENLLFSPLGLSSVMGMVYLAADNKTTKQMESVLGYDDLNIKGKTVHQNNQQLNEGFNRMSRNFVSTNGFFHQNGLQLRQHLHQELKGYYNAEIKSVDFESQPSRAKKSINDWATSKTRGKIDEFVSENLSTDTKVLLLNAIYFKGTWKVRFAKNNTKEKPFYVKEIPRGTVHMMSLTNPTFPYLKDELSGYQYLELPYKGEDMSMLFVLPPTRGDISNHVINPNDFCDIFSKLVPTKLRKVEIPKFQLKYGNSLKDTLSRMGLRHMFAPGTSSFFGSKHDLHISDVVQKSTIEVNEEGSEATSVTSVAFIPLSAREIDEFVANRPFEFYIIHKPSKAILFSGRVTDAAGLTVSKNKRRASKAESPTSKVESPTRKRLPTLQLPSLREFLASFK